MAKPLEKSSDPVSDWLEQHMQSEDPVSEFMQLPLGLQGHIIQGITAAVFLHSLLCVNF